ncbi:hypothetical protein MNEG_13902, partial [Monoraphidium neglectum]
RSSKAVCIHPEVGLLYESSVDMVNVDAILFDPSTLDGPAAGGNASVQPPGAAQEKPPWAAGADGGGGDNGGEAGAGGGEACADAEAA